MAGLLQAAAHAMFVYLTKVPAAEVALSSPHGGALIIANFVSNLASKISVQICQPVFALVLFVPSCPHPFTALPLAPPLLAAEARQRVLRGQPRRARVPCVRRLSTHSTTGWLSSFLGSHR